MHRAITLCDPARLLLPVLHHHASHPATRDELPEDLCAKMVRLALRASASLQKRYVLCAKYHGLIPRPFPYAIIEIDDLLYVQDELADNVLDRYGRLVPGRLEARAAQPQRKMRTHRAA
ncbi:MAG TPA: hypothetical protein VEI03_01055 [Stellaceae bacterium]|nr:hypothetical protein [Stellaceae bacterium]